MVALNRNLGLSTALNVDETAFRARIQHLEPLRELIHVFLFCRNETPQRSRQIFKVELHLWNWLIGNILHYNLVPVIRFLPHSPCFCDWVKKLYGGVCKNHTLLSIYYYRSMCVNVNVNVEMGIMFQFFTWFGCGGWCRCGWWSCKIKGAKLWFMMESISFVCKKSQMRNCCFFYVHMCFCVCLIQESRNLSDLVACGKEWKVSVFLSYMNLRKQGEFGWANSIETTWNKCL